MLMKSKRNELEKAVENDQKTAATVHSNFEAKIISCARTMFKEFLYDIWYAFNCNIGGILTTQPE